AVELVSGSGNVLGVLVVNLQHGLSVEQVEGLREESDVDRRNFDRVTERCVDLVVGREAPVGSARDQEDLASVLAGEEADLGLGRGGPGRWERGSEGSR